ncbi:MAG: response regulator [Coriobacteriia bacterium]
MPLVLLVDDDLGILDVYQLYLESNGYEVVCATDGVSALEVIGRQLPDVMLADVRMPLMDGFTLVDEIRKRGHDIPVVLHTAFDTPEARAQARALRVDDIVFKPSPPGVVMTKLQMALDDHKGPMHSS